MFQKSDTCMRKLHVMSDDNVYVAPKSGQRYCRECMRIRRNKKRKTVVKPGTVQFTMPALLWQSWQRSTPAGLEPGQFLLDYLRERCRQNGVNLEDTNKIMETEEISF